MHTRGLTSFNLPANRNLSATPSHPCMLKGLEFLFICFFLNT